jgi:putative flippase GtrA
MINTLRRLVAAHYRQFVKYVIVGSFGVVLDMATFILLADVFHITPWLAVSMNQAFMLTYVFLLNKYWSFRNTDQPYEQVIRFLMLAGCNYVFSVSAMYLVHHEFGIDHRLVRILSIAVMTTWNFFLYKYWIYRAPSTAPVNNLSESTKEI